MIWSAIEYLAVISEGILNAFFLFRCLAVKENKSKVFLCIAITGYILLKLIHNELKLGYSQYVSILLTFALCRLIFNGKFSAHIVWVIYAITISGIVNFLVMNASVIFPNVDFATTLYPGLPRALCIIAVILLKFACYTLITLRISKDGAMRLSSSLLLMSIAVGCWILLEVLFSYSDALIEPLAFLSLPILGGIGMLLTLTTAVTLYNRLTFQEKEYARLEVQAHSAQLVQSHIAQLNQLHTRLSSLQHDASKHLSVLTAYYESKDYGAIGEYLNNIRAADTDYLSNSTGNIIIDALVGAKHPISKKLGLRFDVNMALPEVLPISDVDLCIVVGNLLDNAFDAAGEISSDKQPFIRLFSRTLEEYLVIVCQNSSEGEALRAIGTLESSKKEGLHGIGTRHLDEISSKTGGYTTYLRENHVFTATVMLKTSPDY